MVRLIKKDRLNNKNENYYIKEGKQVGDLYHVCTLNAFVDHIIEDKDYNNGEGSEDNLHSSGKYTNDLLNTKDIVSFTRDSSFVVPTDTTKNAPLLFQIVVDGNKLSEHYKIYPYQDLKWTKNDPKRSEKEEVVIGPITNFKSYIKEVHFDIKDYDAFTYSNFINKRFIEYINKVITYLGSIECTRANLPYKIGDDGYKKTSSWVFKIKTLKDLIKRIKSRSSLKPKDIDTIDLLNTYLDDGNSLSLQKLNSLYNEKPKLFNKSVINTLLVKSSDNIDVIKFCLEHGEIESKELNKALFSALYDNKTKVVKLLLEHGADPNKADEDKDTPLHLACKNNNLILVKLLLGYNIDVNIQNIYGRTPLDLACDNEDIKLPIVKLLLEHGADPNIKNNFDKTPLYEACSNNNIKVAKLLLEHGASTKEDMDTITSLYRAYQFGNIELIKLLLKYGADKSVMSKSGQEKFGSPLLTAVQSNNLKLVGLVLKNGGEEQINIKDNYGNTPLSVAIINNNKEMIKLLLEYGARPDKDNLNDSLLFSCEKNDIEVAKLLLEFGADPNIKNNFDKTPLYWACDNNNIELVKLLLEHGANPNIILKGYEENSLLHWSVTLDEPEDIEVAKLFIENGADVNVKNKFGVTPLYEACSNNNIKVAKLLLEHGADPNNKDEYGYTPLYRACRRNNTELIKLLLEHGAGKDLDVNNLPDYITKNKEIEDLVLSYLNKNKNESVIVRRLYRRNF